MSATAFDVSITDIKPTDGATPAIEELQRKLAMARVQRAVGTACTLLTKNHLRGLPGNKNGWPSTGFYGKAARGTAWDRTEDGVKISVDTPFAPGAMNQRFHGGTIRMKDKMLTIPARAEFYGHRAGEFVNLRFALFKSGAMALVIGKGGASRVNFSTGTESNRGIGKRTRGMVAYWLKESVTQKGDPNVLPSPEEYIETAKQSILQMVGGGQ